MNLDTLVLLNETVVDRLFDVFGEDFQLKTSYKNFRDFKNHIKIILREYNVDIVFETFYNKPVYGKYTTRLNKIVIFHPPPDKFTFQEMMAVILHEFTHYIKEKRVPGRFNPIGDDSKGYISSEFEEGEISNHLGIYGLFLEKVNSERLMNKILNYWSQPHERTNVAFVIAYDIYESNKNEIDYNNTISKLINTCLGIWENYHKEEPEKTFIEKLMEYEDFINLSETEGLKELLAIIFYRQELFSKNKLDKRLVLSIPRLLELVKKYYIRINRILKKPNKGKIHFENI